MIGAVLVSIATTQGRAAGLTVLVTNWLPPLPVILAALMSGTPDPEPLPLEIVDGPTPGGAR
jgi:hypothetical protein